LGIVGISLAVPILLGSIIVGGAALSRVFLGEVITRHSAGAVLVLLVAIALLGLAAHQSQPVSGNTSSADTPVPSGPWLMVVGSCGAVVAGTAFGTLGVIIRYGVRGHSPMSTATVTVGVVGVVGLGTVSWLRLGWDELLATSHEDLGVMLAAGVCNATAFICLTKALQLLSVVHVNAISASQSAMAAVAGVLIFSEPLRATMVMGVLLTVAGLSLMQSGQEAAEATDRAVHGKPV
jgi:drug/metabolite transporter (DMT)-like permease